MEEKMLQKINEKIAVAKKVFEMVKTYDAIANAEIIGMISMLQLVTGKNYYYDENGVHERK